MRRARLRLHRRIRPCKRAGRPCRAARHRRQRPQGGSTARLVSIVAALSGAERAEATRIVSPRFIRDAHAAGFKVQVWTVDEETDMRRLLEWGVDGLISNRPDLAVRVRDEFLATQATKTVRS